VYLQLGWRNIWRNPRRTVVILTAVVIGVWCMITLGALMRGMIDQMVRNGIATLTVWYARANVAQAFFVVSVNRTRCRAHHHHTNGPLPGPESKAPSTGGGHERSVSAHEY